MKKKEKKLILVLILILAIVIIVKVASKGEKKEEEFAQGQNQEYVDITDNGTKVNKSEALKQAKMVGTLEFTNIQLTHQNGQSVLLADVQNTGSEATQMKLVDIVILDQEGQELGKVGGILSPLEAGETTQFNTSMTRDYSNAYDFQIVEKGE